MAIKTKMANPGPGGLLIVNPSGGNMRKKTTTKRRVSVSRRRHNPIAQAHRRHTRRRNPGFTAGLFVEGLTLAAGGALTQFATSAIPPVGGVSALADAARTAGVAYLLGVVANKVGFGRYARAITLGGMAVAGGKLIQSFLVPFASRVFLPRADTPAEKQIKGIAMQYPGMRPFGLNGIAVQVPGQFPFGEFAPMPEMAN